MTISGLNSLYSTISGVFGGSSNSSSSTSAANTSSASQITDSQQFSPAAMMLSLLQQLQQSNPTEFQQVTGQIATNLQAAAQTAQSAGNSTLATQLNQLAAASRHRRPSSSPSPRRYELVQLIELFQLAGVPLQLARIERIVVHRIELQFAQPHGDHLQHPGVEWIIDRRVRFHR